VSSATDINAKEGKTANGQVPQRTVRPNPVALEVPVSVAGARPVESKDKRELFTEETITVLVFKDGAVIQLSAAVAIGQLLFLTEKRSKKEVVCQVVHKRTHRPTSCFVELEFTEPEENFWGVSFPSQADSAQLPPTAEAVEAEETTEDDGSEPLAAPKSEDVAQLKDEVAALKGQLEELRVKQAPEDKDAVARRLAEAEAAARSAAETEAKQKAEEAARKKAERAKAEAAQAAVVEAGQKLEEEASKKAERVEAAARSTAEIEAGQKAEEEASKKAEEEALKKVEHAKTEAVPWSAAEIEAARKLQEEARTKAEPAKVESAPATVGMRLPSASAGPAAPAGVPQGGLSEAAPGHKGETDPLEDLLPKPALDFSQVPKYVDPNDPFNIYRPERKGLDKRELVVGGVVLAVILGGGTVAWYKNLLPFLHRAPKASVVADVNAASRPGGTAGAASETTAGNDASNGAPASQPAATSTGVSSGNSAAGGVPAPTDAARPASGPIVSPGIESPAERAALAEKSGKRVVAAAKTGTGKSAAEKSGKNHGKAQTSGESAPVTVAPEVSVSDQPILPAKLLKAVPPVYPPDAMRSYITGDVRIEAEVDRQGHVGAMKVLLGPQQFRQAAMDALKQYEYEPATQGGKPVASKVTATIKFWFDP
jgi:TonB family protein